MSKQIDTVCNGKVPVEIDKGYKTSAPRSSILLQLKVVSYTQGEAATPIQICSQPSNEEKQYKFASQRIISQTWDFFLNGVRSTIDSPSERNGGREE